MPVWPRVPALNVVGARGRRFDAAPAATLSRAWAGPRRRSNRPCAGHNRPAHATPAAITHHALERICTSAPIMNPAGLYRPVPERVRTGQSRGFRPAADCGD
jgi:hypothetical protein